MRHCSIRTHDMIEFMQNSERGRAITSFDVQSIKLLPIFLSSTVSEYHIDPMKYSKYFTLLLHSIVSVSAELCAVHCVWPYKPSFWMSNPTTISHHDDDISIVFFCFCVLSNWTVNYLIRNRSCKYKRILMCVYVCVFAGMHNFKLSK